MFWFRTNASNMLNVAQKLLSFVAAGMMKSQMQNFYRCGERLIKSCGVHVPVVE
jgi:hypothetical protein